MALCYRDGPMLELYLRNQSGRCLVTGELRERAFPTRLRLE
jgi:hypothetical protein